MGSSVKKKKEKKKDFKVCMWGTFLWWYDIDKTPQKAKLKVGKARPKPENFTDTSFKSKCTLLARSDWTKIITNRSLAIVLNQQSLATSAPSTTLQFNHHLSLLTHKSDTQRRDSLSFLTTTISARPVNIPLPQPVSVILPALLPLILDGSNSVRRQLIRLLQSLPVGEVEDHVEELLLYVRAGMTHLAADIRVTAIEILDWLLEVAGQETVSCAGGWVKTLKCFLALLGWQNEDGVARWSSNKVSFGRAGSEGKALVKNLAVLASFVKAGLLPISETVEEDPVSSFPLWGAHYHTLPKRSDCYAHLNLFGPPREEENEMYEDREERQRIFHTRFQASVERGLEASRKEGGEVGRAAAVLARAVIEGSDITS